MNGIVLAGLPTTSAWKGGSWGTGGYLGDRFGVVGQGFPRALKIRPLHADPPRHDPHQEGAVHPLEGLILTRHRVYNPFLWRKGVPPRRLGKTKSSSSSLSPSSTSTIRRISSNTRATD